MGCPKLVFVLLLTVFLSQKHSLAYSYEELEEKAKAENQKLQIESASKLIEQLKEKWGDQPNGSRSLKMMEKLYRLNPLLMEVSRLSEMASSRQASSSPSIPDKPFKFEKLDEIRNKMSQMTKEKQELLTSMKSSILARLKSSENQEEMTRFSFPGNGTSDAKAIQECIEVITNLVKDSFSSVSLWRQIITKTLTNVTALLQCFQGGSTPSTTCLQNVIAQIPKNIGNLGNQTMSSFTNLQGDIAKLSTCLTSGSTSSG